MKLLSLSELKDWHGKSVSNMPLPKKHNGYACFYCLRTYPENHVSLSQIINEGVNRRNTLICACWVDSTLTREVLSEAGLELGSPDTQVLLEQLSTLYFTSVCDNVERSVQIQHIRNNRKHELEYSHTPEEIVAHILELKTSPQQPVTGEQA